MKKNTRFRRPIALLPMGALLVVGCASGLTNIATGGAQ